MITKNVTILWTKLIGSIIFMLAGLAMVVHFVMGVTFDTFEAQVVLFLIALSVGIIGAIIAFRTKMVLIR